MNTIDSFSGEHRWLSNFWPCSILFDGHLYPSTEHAYQAAKVHPSQRNGFTRGSPGDAKRLGRRMKMREDWEVVKVDVMRCCLREKFSVGSGLATKLIATGDCKLIEGNTWGDVFWGVCRGTGENRLGRLLMERREELKGWQKHPTQDGGAS